MPSSSSHKFVYPVHSKWILHGKWKVDHEKQSQNLNDAIDVYISRVSGCLCGDMKINLFKGPESKENQKIREFFKVYAKGNEQEKMNLKNNHPDEFNVIESIWNLRDRHLVKGLPAKYVFQLVCCYEKDCIHPECKGGPPDVLPVWYPGGPPLSFQTLKGMYNCMQNLI